MSGRGPGRPVPVGSRETAVDDFWEASSLDAFGVAEFAAGVLTYEDRPLPVHPFTPPGAPRELKPPRDRLQRILDARRSERSFSSRPLRHRQIERILAATGPAPDGHRVVPEAGGLPAVHVYALVRSARGHLDGQVVRYDHDRHTATVLRPVPADDRLRELFLLTEPTLPQLVLAFVVDPRAVLTKYGPRGGRFLLQQVGHAAQNVSLRLAYHRGLRGYVLGGGLDHDVLHVLGLAATNARYASAFAIGR